MIRTLLIAFLFIGITSHAQKSIKGSRNVTTEQTEISAFTAIELEGEYEVGLLKGNRTMVEVEADDNLHSLFQIEVVDSILYIKPTAKITKSKSQKLTITFSDSLTRLSLDGKVDFESLQHLYCNDFEFISKGRSKSKITATASKFRLHNSDYAKAEIDIASNEIDLELTGSSDLEGVLKGEVLNVRAIDKSSAKLNGNVTELVLNASKSSKFNGEELITSSAEVFATGNSRNSVNVSQALKLSAKDKSEVNLYNNPEIDLVDFSEKAVLSKKS